MICCWTAMLCYICTFSWFHLTACFLSMLWNFYQSSKCISPGFCSTCNMLNDQSFVTICGCICYFVYFILLQMIGEHLSPVSSACPANVSHLLGKWLVPCTNLFKLLFGIWMVTINSLIAFLPVFCYLFSLCPFSCHHYETETVRPEHRVMLCYSNAAFVVDLRLSLKVMLCFRLRKKSWHSEVRCVHGGCVIDVLITASFLITLHPRYNAL